jgi:hypothetical protein
MKHTRYFYSSEKFFTVYKFDSEGRNGKVKKLVLFTKTSTENVYNLAFGDLDDLTGEIDDFAVTNNGDRAEVLGTVAATVYEFIQKYPRAWVVATGSTPARTRLYQMSISKYLEFVVGEVYEMFLLTKKGNELSI